MKIITKQHAIQNKLTRYFTGNPCKRGHISERYTISGMCCDCSLVRYSNKIYKNNDVREKLLRISKNKCWYCGDNITISKMRIDHLVPKSKGGKDIFSNYRPSCVFCNLSKTNLSLEQYRLRVAYQKEERPNIPKNILEFLNNKNIFIPEPPRHIFWFEEEKLEWS